jgi:molybdopterin-containing oxidoreductase family membrane subunit
VTDQIHVTGFFTDEEPCVRGIAALRAAGFDRPRVFSPFASEKVREALRTARSPVRLWVFLGGITGCAGGFALTIGLSAEYPHVTAGMPIVSIPPFVIIAFELTILCGALSGVLGFLVHGGFPRRESEPGYDAQFTDDRFGVVVRCTTADRPRAEALLRKAGAAEVKDAPA